MELYYQLVPLPAAIHFFVPPPPKSPRVLLDVRLWVKFVSQWDTFAHFQFVSHWHTFSSGYQTQPKLRLIYKDDGVEIQTYPYNTREIDEIIERQQKTLFDKLDLETISLIEQKPELKELPTVKVANEIKTKLKMNLGAALSLSFGVVELQSHLVKI